MGKPALQKRNVLAHCIWVSWQIDDGHATDDADDASVHASKLRLKLLRRPNHSSSQCWCLPVAYQLPSCIWRHVSRGESSAACGENNLMGRSDAHQDLRSTPRTDDRGTRLKKTQELTPPPAVSRCWHNWRKDAKMAASLSGTKSVMTELMAKFEDWLAEARCNACWTLGPDRSTYCPLDARSLTVKTAKFTATWPRATGAAAVPFVAVLLLISVQQTLEIALR